jgi:hypothetical protein
MITISNPVVTFDRGTSIVALRFEALPVEVDQIDRRLVFAKLLALALREDT